MKHFLFGLALLVGGHTTWAQISFQSEAKMRESIRSQPSSLALNKYLREHDMMNIKYSPFSEENDSVLFDLDLIKIDVFKKNLFGDEREEMIVQLRQKFTIGPNDPLPRYPYWSVFILQQKHGVWEKVPGSLSPYHYHDTRQYQLPGFTFEFESIKSPESFSLISKQFYNHNLREETSKTIWEITSDTIYAVMSWTTYVNNVRGDFRDLWGQTSTSTFSSDKWPKTLIVNTKRESDHEMYFKTSDGEILDTLSGRTEKVKTTAYYEFTISKIGLMLKKESTKSKKQTIHFKEEE